MQLCVRGNDGLALPGTFAALLEQGTSGLQGRSDRVDRRGGIRRAGHGVHDELLQCARAPEQDLALVGEVPEERPLREPRPLGDLRHRGLLEPALAVQSEGGLLEPAARVWLPSTHAPIVVDDSG